MRPSHAGFFSRAPTSSSPIADGNNGRTASSSEGLEHPKQKYTIQEALLVLFAPFARGFFCGAPSMAYCPRTHCRNVQPQAQSFRRNNHAILKPLRKTITFFERPSARWASHCATDESRRHIDENSKHKSRTQRACLACSKIR